jgi:hypothetical protein
MAKVPINRRFAGAQTKLFAVYNTAHNKMYVLAKDESAALSVAYAANHVYSPRPNIGLNYSRLSSEVFEPDGELSKHWDKLQQAGAQGIEATVHFHNEQLYLGTSLFNG